MKPRKIKLTVMGGGRIYQPAFPLDLKDGEYVFREIHKFCIDPKIPHWHASGRSTGLAFKILADAYQNKGSWILVRDHHGTIAADFHLMDQIGDIIVRLEFDFFKFDKKNRAIKFEGIKR